MLEYSFVLRNASRAQLFCLRNVLALENYLETIVVIVIKFDTARPFLRFVVEAVAIFLFL